MDRFDLYFRQLVTEADLDAAFDDVEVADHLAVADLAFDGVATGLVVSQHAPVPDFTVDVTPGTTYDPTGRRVRIATSQVMDCSEDEGGVPTAVTTPGNERWISVFAEFDRVLSDPRTDGNGQTVYYRRAESFVLNVAQGSEELIGNAVRPPLRDDQTLLCDVRLEFGDASILNARISTTRRQDAVVVAGTPNAIRANTLREAIGDLVTAFNAHVTNLASGHPASTVVYAGGGAWANGITNPTCSVEAQLDKVISDLASTMGASCLGSYARSAWLGGRTNPAVTTILEAVSKIIDDLGVTDAGDDGAERIGATANMTAPATLTTGSVRSQLDEIVTHLNVRPRLGFENIYTPPAGSAIAKTTSHNEATGYQLIFQFSLGASGNYLRIYAVNTGSIVFTFNARWSPSDTKWYADVNDIWPTKWLMEGGLRFTGDQRTGVISAGDSWLDSGWHLGVILSPGWAFSTARTYVHHIGAQVAAAGDYRNRGIGGPWFPQLSAAPGSITIVEEGRSGCSVPVETAKTAFGWTGYVTVDATGIINAAEYRGLVYAA